MSRLSTRMRRWGVVLRIASRDARQSFGRTLTAVILISLPIIVAIGSITFWDVTTSQRYQASSWLGHTSNVQAVTLRRSSTALDQDITADVLSKTASDDEIDVTMETLTNWVPPPRACPPIPPTDRQPIRRTCIPPRCPLSPRPLSASIMPHHPPTR